MRPWDIGMASMVLPDRKRAVKSATKPICVFFQAEDGIRDSSVTGVQTCALPISPGDDVARLREQRRRSAEREWNGRDHAARHLERSEERRVGKECRSRGAPY